MDLYAIILLILLIVHILTIVVPFPNRQAPSITWVVLFVLILVLLLQSVGRL